MCLQELEMVKLTNTVKHGFFGGELLRVSFTKDSNPPELIYTNIQYAPLKHFLYVTIFTTHGMHHDINSSLHSENVCYCLYTEHSSIHLQCYKSYRMCTLVINITSIVQHAGVRLTQTHPIYLFNFLFV